MSRLRDNPVLQGKGRKLVKTSYTLFGVALFLYLGVLTPSTLGTQACAVPEGGWIAIGDSITLGYGASTYAQSWVGLLSTHLSQTVDNRAISGAVSGNMLVNQIGGYSGSAQNAVILCCINDLQAGFTVTDTLNSVGQFVPALQAKGFQNIWIAPHVPTAVWYNGPAWWDVVMARRNPIAEAASADGAKVVWISGFNPSAMLTADGIHPNNYGHRIIEQSFWSSISCDFRVYFPFVSQ